MTPRKVILDTNLWISFLISDKFQQIDKYLLNDKIKLIFSKELLDEFIEVALRPKFSKYFKSQDIEALLRNFDKFGQLVKVETNVHICRDAKDNFLLNLALDSKADYLVTGDADLLDLKTIGQTQIITMTEFVKIRQ
ncbi:MAG: putative toxin-antitoxin system toxin component, PIN family [Desulfobulbaceae bacterium]|nr:putative toxin-antitoxin system toxin component, PIN family [Desulfobulbaceae bacterium]